MKRMKTKQGMPEKPIRVFDFSLFLDVIGRIWIPAAFGAAGCLLLSLLISPILQALGYSTCLFGLIDCCNLLPYFAVLFTPILTLNAFSFLFKRREADFYDALPYSRFSLFTTSLLAAVAVSFAATLVVSAASAVITLITVSCAVIDFASFFIELLAILLGTVLSATVTALSCATSGHRVQATLTSVMILFAPSLLFKMADSTITAYVPYLVSGKLFMITPCDLNIATVLIASKIEGLYSFYPYLYTSVLAFIYFDIGLHLFIRRKSEAASHAAASDKIRHIFRIVSASLLTLPAAMTMTFEDIDFGVYLFSLLLALCFYFIYEFVTTKKLVDTLKTAVFIPIILVVDVLAFLGVTYFGKYEVNFAPDDAFIVGVTVLPSDSGRLTVEEYVTLRASENEIKDDIARTIVGDALRAQVKAYQNDRYSYLEKEDEEITTVTVAVESFGKHVRQIRLSTINYRILMSLLNTSADYYDRYADLPENPLKLADSEYYAPISEENLKSVWKAAREEIQAMGGKAYLNLLRDEVPTATILYSVRYHGKNYEVILPIFGEMTETAKRYAAAKTEAVKKAKANAVSAVNRILTESLSCSYCISIGNERFYSGYMPSEDSELLTTVTASLSDLAQTTDESLISLSVMVDIYENDYEYYQYKCFVTSEVAEQILSLMKYDEYESDYKYIEEAK